MSTGLKGLILGAFSNASNGVELTPKAKSLDAKINGKLMDTLKKFKFDPRSKKSFIMTSLCDVHPFVVIAGLGDVTATYCPVQEIDLKLENIRSSIYKAIKTCHENEIYDIVLDDCGNPKSVGEMASLSKYEIPQWKSDFKKKPFVFSLLDEDAETLNKFETGCILGEAQVYAASLSDCPANMKFPKKIAERITASMPSSVKCITRDKEWIRSQKMEMFLSVNQGSSEPAVLLEAHYKGTDAPPTVLVGKGITFDSGGISLKPSQAMAEMKADMQGAAVVFGTIRAIAMLKLPIHIIAIAPFTENLPSGSATKPGDVFTAMNGMTVEVDNTDAEGRLVLGDALTYAETFKPCQIIDLATLTGAVCVALGNAASALYTKSPTMLKNFKNAASLSGDRVWHMPLYKEYTKMIDSKVADLVNSTKKREAGSCTAAAFLNEFVTIKEWAHLDIAGVMNGDKETCCYVPGGMSGRPARTLLEYILLQHIRN